MLELKHLKSFKNDDANAISSLFKIVYGDNYVYPEVYNPETFRKNHEEGIWQSVIAVGTNDQVVGHGLLWIHAHCPQIPEMGLIIVHPDARNLGLASKIAQALIELAKKNNMIGIATKQVCSHPFSQRLGNSLGFVNLSFWPEYVTPIFGTYADRESILWAYLPLKISLTKTLYISESLTSSAQLLTNGLHTIESVKKPILPMQTSMIKVLKSENDISEVYIKQWGTDGLKHLDRLTKSTHTFVLLNAETPENTLACEKLLSAGFVFMGLAPDRVDSWTWVFTRPFSLETTFVLDEKINVLIQHAKEHLLQTNSVFEINLGASTLVE